MEKMVVMVALALALRLLMTRVPSENASMATRTLPPRPPATAVMRLLQ